jgi:hypothetical protein
MAAADRRSRCEPHVRQKGNTMKIALVGLLGLSMLKGCDMGDPASVQPQMEEALRPYFPRVKAVALPQQQTLVGLSCLENVGDELVKMVPAAVASNPAMSKLKLLRMFPGSSYSTVSIGFERSLAVYNLDTGLMGTAPMDDAYANWYRQQCGFDGVYTSQVSQETPQVQTVSGGHQVYVFVGHFTIKVSNSQGVISTRHTVDSLGIWPDEDTFSRNKGLEVNARKRVLRESLPLTGETFVHLNLESVEKVAINLQ